MAEKNHLKIWKNSGWERKKAVLMCKWHKIYTNIKEPIIKLLMLSTVVE